MNVILFLKQKQLILFNQLVLNANREKHYVFVSYSLTIFFGTVKEVSLVVIQTLV